MVKAVILVGGHSKGSRYRPLWFDLPKPLFPIAGRPLLYHHVAACAKIPNISEVLLLGFYEAKLFEHFIMETTDELKVQIRYLQEAGPLGTAGGIRFFRDDILGNKPEDFFVLYSDNCITASLNDMLQFHLKHGKIGTVLGKKVPEHDSGNYGCLVLNKSNEIIHFAEKPQTYVSDICNCGVYLFSPNIMEYIEKASLLPHDDILTDETLNPIGYASFEKDVFSKLCDIQELTCHQFTGIWQQCKSAGMALKCTELLLAQYQTNQSERLSVSQPGRCSIRGNVLIDPTAVIDLTAEIGPNVCIGPGVKIGKGVRIMQSTILDHVVIKDHTFVKHSIIGWKSVIGSWARIEGTPEFQNADTLRSGGITILGSLVSVVPEVLIRNSIVLPNKHIMSNCKDEILL